MVSEERENSAQSVPQAGFSVAQVVLGKEQVEQARSLTLGKHVAEVFSKAAQFHDGRWLYAPVKTVKDAKDIQELVALKRKPAPGKNHRAVSHRIRKKHRRSVR